MSVISSIKLIVKEHNFFFTMNDAQLLKSEFTALFYVIKLIVFSFFSLFLHEWEFLIRHILLKS